MQLIPALLLALGTTLLPYSPRWLASQSRDAETLAVLSKLRERPQTDPSVLRGWREIKVEVALLKDTKTSWKEIWHRRIRRRTLIGVGIMFFQQFSGINALLYYAYLHLSYLVDCSPTVFESFGLPGETAILRASGVINIIQLLASMPVIFTLDLLGRRPLLLIGSVLPGEIKLI